MAESIDKHLVEVDLNLKNLAESLKSLKSVETQFGRILNSAKQIHGNIASFANYVRSSVIPALQKMLQPIMELTVISKDSTNVLGNLKQSLMALGKDNAFISLSEAAKTFADISKSSFYALEVIAPKYRKEIVLISNELKKMGMADVGTAFFQQLGKLPAIEEDIINAMKKGDKSTFMRLISQDIDPGTASAVFEAYKGNFQGIAGSVTDLNSLMSVFQVELENAFVEFVEDNGPMIKELVEAFTKGIRQFFNLIRENKETIKEVFENFGKYVVKAVEGLTGLIEKVEKYRKTLKAIGYVGALQMTTGIPGMAAKAAGRSIYRRVINRGARAAGTAAAGSKLAEAAAAASRSASSAAAASTAAQASWTKFSTLKGGIGGLAGQLSLALAGITIASMAVKQFIAWDADLKGTGGSKDTWGGKLAEAGMWQGIGEVAKYTTPGTGLGQGIQRNLGSAQTVIEEGKSQLEPEQLAALHAKQLKYMEANNAALAAEEERRKKEAAGEDVGGDKSETPEKSLQTLLTGLKGELDLYEASKQSLQANVELTKLLGRETRELGEVTQIYDETIKKVENKLKATRDEYAKIKAAAKGGEVDILTATKLRIEMERASLELNKAILEKFKAMTAAQEAQLSLRETEEKVYRTQLSMVEAIYGTPALALDAMANIMAKLEEEAKIATQIYEARKKQREEIEASHGDITEVRKLELEALDQVNQKNLQRLQMMKTLRDGYLDAVKAQSFGLGAFNKLLITQEQNIGLAQRMGASRRNYLLGLTMEKEEGPRAYRYSASGGFEMMGGGAMGRKELESRREIIGDRLTGFQKVFYDSSEQFSKKAISLNQTMGRSVDETSRLTAALMLNTEKQGELIKSSDFGKNASVLNQSFGRVADEVSKLTTTLEKTQLNEDQKRIVGEISNLVRKLEDKGGKAEDKTEIADKVAKLTSELATTKSPEVEELRDMVAKLSAEISKTTKEGASEPVKLDQFYSNQESCNKLINEISKLISELQKNSQKKIELMGAGDLTVQISSLIEELNNNNQKQIELIGATELTNEIKQLIAELRINNKKQTNLESTAGNIDVTKQITNEISRLISEINLNNQKQIELTGANELTSEISKLINEIQTNNQKQSDLICCQEITSEISRLITEIQIIGQKQIDVFSNINQPEAVINLDQMSAEISRLISEINLNNQKQIKLTGDNELTDEISRLITEIQNTNQKQIELIGNIDNTSSTKQIFNEISRLISEINLNNQKQIELTGANELTSEIPKLSSAILAGTQKQAELIGSIGSTDACLELSNEISLLIDKLSTNNQKQIELTGVNEFTVEISRLIAEIQSNNQKQIEILGAGELIAEISKLISAIQINNQKQIELTNNIVGLDKSKQISDEISKLIIGLETNEQKQVELTGVNELTSEMARLVSEIQINNQKQLEALNKTDTTKQIANEISRLISEIENNNQKQVELTGTNEITNETARLTEEIKLNNQKKIELIGINDIIQEMSQLVSELQRLGQKPVELTGINELASSMLNLSNELSAKNQQQIELVGSSELIEEISRLISEIQINSQKQSELISNINKPDGLKQISAEITQLIGELNNNNKQQIELIGINELMASISRLMSTFQINNEKQVELMGGMKENDHLKFFAEEIGKMLAELQAGTKPIELVGQKEISNEFSKLIDKLGSNQKTPEIIDITKVDDSQQIINEISLLISEIQLNNQSQLELIKTLQLSPSIASTRPGSSKATSSGTGSAYGDVRYRKEKAKEALSDYLDALETMQTREEEYSGTAPIGGHTI